jgi:hypothetical protein
MPILTLQRQLRELGRIRTGNVVTTPGGKSRPNKLDTFRLTSESRELIEAAAEAYGGTVTPWVNPAGGQEYEVVTITPVLDIVVPPGQPVSQWFEMWSGGGCVRRCDGETNVLTMGPCLCPQDPSERVELAGKGEACKATTRLSVILPALPDLGVWRLESHGYYAAVELAGAAELLAMASAAGRLIPARLRLEQREQRRPGQPTKKYAVPIIEFVETRFAGLGITASTDGAPELASGRVSSGRPDLPAIAAPTSSTFRPSDGRDAELTQGVAAGATPDPDGPQRGPEEPSGDPAVITSIDHPTLVASLGLLDIPLADAIERSKVMFPRGPRVPLTDEQRAELLNTLAAEGKAP